ncbi:neuropilin-1-like [Mytilus trossulus]|uniref:neuropilin-1-like n=1 Tax=Mytilus trossulus TaxID=6551 RepID=UPI003004ACB2
MKTNTVLVVIFLTVLCNNGGIYAVIPIGELGCSFETDFCKWNIVSSTHWARYRYRHPLSGSTGPQNAKDGAFYIHTTETNDTDNEKIASLESDTFNKATSSGKICFTFWYHMHGIHVQNLTVTVGGRIEFNTSGNQGQEWHCGVIDATGLSGKIKFNAHRTDSNSPYSIIALDYFQVVNSDTCSQQNCESLEASSSIIPGTTSLASITSSTTEKVSTQITPSGGVIEILPIAIGVPCGVLIVGAIIVGVCIHKRKKSRELIDMRRTIGSINPYDTTPRQSAGVISGIYDDEEIYNELNEDEMEGTDNGGYLDAVPPSYDEIGNVEVRQNGNVGYINHKSERPPSEDYLTPISAQNNQPNRPDNDYSHSGSVPNGRPQSDDYLKPGEFLKDDVNL